MKKYILAMVFCLLPSTIMAEEIYIFPGFIDDQSQTKFVHPDKCVEARQKGISDVQTPNKIYYDGKLYGFSAKMVNHTLDWQVVCSEHPVMQARDALQIQ